MGDQGVVGKREKFCQRTFATVRVRPAAVLLARFDDKRVEFVEDLVLARESGFECRAKLFITGLRMRDAVAFEDAAGVSVDDEDRMLAGVEKDRVRGFGADPAKSKKLFTENLRWPGKQAIERPAVVGKEKGNEG